jgi:NADPH2:quinone reductase
MNAAVVESFEKPPRYTTFPDPVPTAEEILVNVTAAGLHPIVKALAKGAHYGSTGQLPLIPGVDGVGREPDGTRIFFGGSRPPYGTFAERAITKTVMCFPIPDSLFRCSAFAVLTVPPLGSIPRTPLA